MSVVRWKITTKIKRQKKTTEVYRKAVICYLDGFQSFTLVIKVVEAINTVAVITEFPVGKAITIPVRREIQLLESKLQLP